MAEDIRWQQRFANYQLALQQLDTFFEPPALNDREQQGLIKAFEYTFELAWNLPCFKDLYARLQQRQVDELGEVAQ